MTHPTGAQIEAAIKSLRAMIEAAENSNHAGEDAVMVAAAGPELLQAIEPFEKGLRIAEWSADATNRHIPDAVPMGSGFAWREDGRTRTLTWGDLRALAAAAAKARGEA